MSKKYYTDEEKQLITELYKEKKSLTEIAQVCNRSVSAIRTFLHTAKTSQGGSVRHAEIVELTSRVIADYLSNTDVHAIDLAKKYNMSDKTILKILNGKGINTKYSNGRNCLVPNTDIFQNIDTEEKAYWLGFLYADGSIDKKRRTLSITQMSKSIDILEKFCKFLDVPVKLIKKRKNRPSEQYLKISSVILCKDLIKHGIIPNKTYEGILPEVSEELMKDFVRGLWDGDGAMKKGRCIQLTGSKDTTEKVLSWLLLQGVGPDGIKIYSYKPTTHQLIINRYAVGDLVTAILYKDATVYLNRKNPYHNCPSVSQDTECIPE